MSNSVVVCALVVAVQELLHGCVTHARPVFQRQTLALPLSHHHHPRWLSACHDGVLLCCCAAVLLCRHEKKKNMYSTLRQLEFVENANTYGVFHDAPEVCVVV